MQKCRNVRAMGSVKIIGVTLLTAAGLTGCANHQASSRVYTFDQTQRAQTVVLAQVTGVRPIVIQAESSGGLGMAAGGVVGGLAGNTIGGGSGRRLATAGGAIGGAMAGNAVENARNRRQGVEITLRLDSGDTRVIAQEADVPIFVGQRVQVITHGNTTRVVPL